jgi:hypothetical protein
MSAARGRQFLRTVPETYANFLRSEFGTLPCRFVDRTGLSSNFSALRASARKRAKGNRV